ILVEEGERQPGDQASSPQRIGRRIGGDAIQPGRQGRCLNRCTGRQRPVGLDKHVLREIVGLLAVAHKSEYEVGQWRLKPGEDLLKVIDGDRRSRLRRPLWLRFLQFGCGGWSLGLYAERLRSYRDRYLLRLPLDRLRRFTRSGLRPLPTTPRAPTRLTRAIRVV